MAMIEFTNQRMHRRPAPALKPFSHPTMNPNPYETTSGATYKVSAPGPRVVPQFTIGQKNDLATANHFRKVDMNTFRLTNIDFGSQPRANWQTTAGSDFNRPDQMDALKGSSAPRSGIAPRMPYSEVERRFNSLDSAGTMPGTVGKPSFVSETMVRYGDPGREGRANARPEPMLTLGTMNDIGSTSKYRSTPAMLADRVPHFELGKHQAAYRTAAMVSTQTRVVFEP